MTMNAPDIPDHFRAEAIALGLPEALIGLKWIEHCEWMTKSNPGRDFGGAPWSRFVRSVVADLNERKSKQEILDDRARREAAIEASRRREAELLYREQAISLDDWLATLRRRLQAGDTSLKPHEVRLAEHPRHAWDTCTGTWLLEALSPEAAA